MRRIVIMSFTVFLVIVVACGYVYAIQGVCSGCHTMHNSQNGQYQVQIYNGSGALSTGVSTPQDYLLLADCIGCHTGPTGDTDATNSFGAPIVLHITCPSGQQGVGSTLAGGDFCFVANGISGRDDRYGHNVVGLAGPDSLITPTNTPPGFHSGATPGEIPSDGAIGSTWASNQLSCAGTYGCHGMHTSAGITGAHHNNTGLRSTQADCSSLTPSTIGSSYRFLGGICGLEQDNWNWDETISSHNEYYGANNATGRNLTNTSYSNKRTISYSCAQCHGYFHSQIDDSVTNGSSPWRRHPTDIMLPNSGEYASYNPNVAGSPRTYNLVAPIARPSLPPSNVSQVTPGSDAVVMCLSCHRAHGAPELDILRWHYEDMVAGNAGSDSGTGCFVCHTTKD